MPVQLGSSLLLGLQEPVLVPQEYVLEAVERWFQWQAVGKE